MFTNCPVWLMWWLGITATLCLAYAALWYAQQRIIIRQRKQKADKQQQQQFAIGAMTLGLRVEFYDRLLDSPVKVGRVIKFDPKQQYAVVRTQAGEICAPSYCDIIRAV